MRRLFLFLAFCLIGSPALSQAAEIQEIKLDLGWNLVCIQLIPEPSDPSVVFGSLGNDFIAAWTFDKQKGKWYVYYNPGGPDAEKNFLDPMPPVQPGKAYWVYMKSAANFNVAGSVPLTGVTVYLDPGWNMVGFPSGGRTFLEDISLMSILESSGAEYDVILKWEADQYRKFTSDETDQDDFVLYEPDRGYWVNITGAAVSLKPSMVSSIRADVDVEPQGNFPSYEDFQVSRAGQGSGARYRTDLNAGLSDPLGPDTQTHISFFEGEDVQTISITNSGGGIMLWDLEWKPTDNPGDDWLTFSSMQGVTTIETDIVSVFLDRKNLFKGVYRGEITIHSNDKDRVIQVVAEIPSLAGEWRGHAEIETVNGRHNPVPRIDLHLDMYEDEKAPSFLRGTLDSTNALLWPVDVPLTGHVLSTKGNSFLLSGSYILPPGDQNRHFFTEFPGTEDVDWSSDGSFDAVNPFPFPIQRSLTLTGSLVSGTTREGYVLEGGYTETVAGMLREPIELKGAFTLSLESPDPFTNRKATPNSESADGAMPVVIRSESPNKSLAVSPVEQTLHIITDMILQDISVELDITHPAPKDISISLIAPDSTIVRLHDQAPIASLQNMSFPEGRAPRDSFSTLFGKNTVGYWKLKVENHGTDNGTLNRWKLRLQGQPVFTIYGKVIDADSGTGLEAEVLLNGLPYAMNTKASSDGTFSFSNVPASPFNLTASYLGYEPENPAMPGITNGRFAFANCIDTDPDEAALAAAFRPLPGVPNPASSMPGYPGTLGTVADPWLIELKQRTDIGEMKIIAFPSKGPAPHLAWFTLLDPRDQIAPGTEISWDFGDGQNASDPDLFTTSHTYNKSGSFTVGSTAGTHHVEAAILVMPSPNNTDYTFNFFQVFFTGGGAIPKPLTIGSEPLLMTQHADCANFDVDRAPFTSPTDRDFDNDGLSGTGDDDFEIFKGEDTDYFHSSDPCTAPNGRYDSYPQSSASGVCREPRYRMTCNMPPQILPASYDCIRAAPDDPGVTAPDPPPGPDSDGIAKSRELYLVTGPLAAFWNTGGR